MRIKHKRNNSTETAEHSLSLCGGKLLFCRVHARYVITYFNSNIWMIVRTDLGSSYGTNIRAGSLSEGNNRVEVIPARISMWCTTVKNIHVASKTLNWVDCKRAMFTMFTMPLYYK